MPIVATNHIFVDVQGIPWIANTTTKVSEVVSEHKYGGLSPDEIHAEHPHLMLSQIHAALSYYYDHKSEIDEEIARRKDTVEKLRAQAGPQLTRAVLEKRLLKSSRVK